MKINKIKYSSFLVCALLAGSVSSCKRIEIEPREFITEDKLFDVTDKNGRYLERYYYNIYTYLPNGFNRVDGDFLDAATNDAVPSRNDAAIERFTNGSLSDINNPDSYWSQSYSGIRHVNNLLANVDKVPLAETIKAPMKAEVRFIRAMLYFELMKRYGGVPLVGDKVFTLNDDMELPRNTFEEVVNYITSECDAIKPNLLNDNIVSTAVGKVTKGAAYALKCRTLLYAASPLFNGGAITGYKNGAELKSAGITGYPNADNTRWNKVIQEAESFITNSTYFALPTSNNPQFSSIFITSQSSDIILSKGNAQSSNLENDNAPVGYINANTRGRGRTSPTQDFVDAFPLASGAPATPLTGPTNTDPYAGRDARLAATVFYNGSPWLNRSGGVQTFEGGLDKPNNASTSLVQTKTGYYLRKFLGNFNTSTAYGNVLHNFILFRTSEIYLNYAEALNEVGSRTEEAVTQLGKVRRRAGIPAGADLRYGIPANISQAALRDLIRNERRIELAFEEHRFFDLRRWKIANTVLNGPVYGVKITRNGTINTYERVQVGTLSFRDRDYLLPIPFSEIIKNKNIKQNPGWSEFK
ncbi:MAG: RagB/SusD family nutrient uptake outer membrane protein [Sphingobacteriaceae bacterium]|nr:RagB/SusD family nutrient uptake outer membrane protein [Sphingobacteriaceae bacterium]